MGVSYNPAPIVTNGLLLNLDAPNSKSYTGQENLLRYSEEFDNVLWAYTSFGTLATAQAGAEIAPDGTPTADLITFTVDSTGQSRRTQFYSGLPSGTYTASVYVKRGTLSQVAWFLTTNQVPYPNATYNFDTDVVSGGGTFTRTIIGNGWVRLTSTFTITTHDAGIGFIASNSGTVYAWGAQLETGSTASTYTRTQRSAITRSWFDLSSNSNNGVLVNNPIYTSGTNGYLTFNYLNSQYVNFPSNASFNFLNRDPYTLEAWVYPTRNPGANNWTGIFDRESTFNGNRDGYNLYFLGSAGTDTYFFTERFTSGIYNPVSVTLNQSVSLNRWHHIVGTYDGTTLSLYRNGSIVGSNASTGNLINTSKELNIGVRGGQYFDGRISNAKVYNRALSAAEVAQNFASSRVRYGI